MKVSVTGALKLKELVPNDELFLIVTNVQFDNEYDCRHSLNDGIMGAGVQIRRCGRLCSAWVAPSLFAVLVFVCSLPNMIPSVLVRQHSCRIRIIHTRHSTCIGSFSSCRVVCPYSMVSNVDSQRQRGGGNFANVIDSLYNERWACRETHPVDTLFKAFDHGGTAYYRASRNCVQACLDDDVCISYDLVGSQAQADSCRFYSEATLPENHHPSVERRLYRAAQNCEGHCGPIMKEGCSLSRGESIQHSTHCLGEVILPSRLQQVTSHRR